MFGIFGLIFGVFAFLGVLFGGGGAIGIIFAILFPILYGIFGFVIGTISALLYSWAANRVGGLEIELSKGLLGFLSDIGRTKRSSIYASTAETDRNLLTQQVGQVRTSSQWLLAQL